MTRGHPTISTRVRLLYSNSRQMEPPTLIAHFVPDKHRTDTVQALGNAVTTSTTGMYTGTELKLYLYLLVLKSSSLKQVILIAWTSS